MTSQTEADELITERVDGTVEEFEERREREVKRHEEKLSEIEEGKSEQLQELWEEAGLDELSEKHQELRDLKSDVSSLSGKIQNRFYDVITEYLSGGYDQTITVKNGSIHRYRKQKNSRISFSAVVSGYASSITTGLYNDAPRSVADATKEAFEVLSESDVSVEPSWSANILMDTLEYKETLSYRSNHYEFEEVYVRYSVSYSKSSNIKFRENEDGTRRNRVSVDFTKDKPKNIKLLAQRKGDVLAGMENVEAQMKQTLRNMEYLYEKIDSLLPDVE